MARQSELTGYGVVTRRGTEVPAPVRLCEDTVELLKRLASQATTYRATREAVEKEVSRKGVLSMATNILSQTLPHYLGITGAGAIAVSAICSCLPIAAAQTAESSLTFFAGQRPGGTNRCAGYILDCLQGYANNGTVAILDWDRIVSDISHDGQFVLKEALKSCVNINKVQEVIERAISQTPDGAFDLNRACATNGPLWRQLQVTGAISGLSQEACVTFQNEFNAMLRACQNSNTILTSWSYVGMGVGAVVGLAIIVGVTIACCKHGPPSSCNNCNNP